MRDPAAVRIGRHTALIVGAALVVVPFLWMITTSLQTRADTYTNTSLVPTAWHWENFATAWSAAPFGRYYLNSLLMSAGIVAGHLVLDALAAYAFARLRFPFKNALFVLLLAALIVPTFVTIIPAYTLVANLGWINSYLPLIVPHFFATAAFFVFLMVQFIRGLPGDLDDAARVDGCGPARTYFYIVLPLLKPAIVTTVIFTFIWTYNDFFSQLLYISDSNLFTVPLGLRMFLDATGQSSWGPMFAMAVLSLIPVFLIFMFFQRLIVEGIATTGLK